MLQLVFCVLKSALCASHTRCTHVAGCAVDSCAEPELNHAASSQLLKLAPPLLEARCSELHELSVEPTLYNSSLRSPAL